jgi:hypothetical protein
MRQDRAHAAAVHNRAQDAVLNVVGLSGPDREPGGNGWILVVGLDQFREKCPLLLCFKHYVASKTGVSAATLQIGLGAKHGVISIIFRRPIMIEQIRADIP